MDQADLVHKVLKANVRSREDSAAFDCYGIATHTISMIGSGIDASLYGPW